MSSQDLPISKNPRSTRIVDAEIINTDSKLTINKDDTFNNDQKTLLITEGAKLVNRVMDIIHLQEQTNSTLVTLDKQIELVERTTQKEIEKMVAETDNWERRFSMVSKVLKEMTLTVTENKDLHPDVAKSLIDTVKLMVDKLSVK